MSDETQSTPAGLPPKLDLRSKMGVKPSEPALSVKPFQGKRDLPAGAEETVSEARTMRKETMHIKLTDESVAPSAAGPDGGASEASAASAPESLAPKLNPRSLAKPEPAKPVEPAVITPEKPAAEAAPEQPATTAPTSVKKVMVNKPAGVKRVAVKKPLPPSAEPKTSEPATQAPKAADAPAEPKPLTPKTVTVKPTPLSPKPATAASHGEFGSAVSEAKKKETSKVPLDSALPEDAPVGPKTIKVKPIALNGVKPGVLSSASDPEEQDPKRQTSRIPLQQALGDAASNGPKTIRLKRPGEVAAPKPTETAKLDEDDVPKKTTQLDEAALGDVSGATLTQKRTIKVKRPQSAGGGGGLSVKRTSSPSSAPVGVGAPAGAPVLSHAPVKDGAHWTFITCAILTIIVLICTIYLFAAQAVGPNHGLTQLSSLIDGPDLTVPGNGKLPRG
jgi:hypothetical protein